MDYLKTLIIYRKWRTGMKRKIVIVATIFGIAVSIFLMVLCIFQKHVSITDLILEIFASFMGFGLALIASEISEKIKEYSERVNLLSNIYKELIVVKNTIEKIDPNLCWIKPLKVPYLKSSIQTQKIALLSSKKYDKIHNNLLELEDLIEDYNLWHELLTKSTAYSGGNRTFIITNETQEIGKDIICHIENILTGLSKF